MLHTFLNYYLPTYYIIIVPYYLLTYLTYMDICACTVRAACGLRAGLRFTAWRQGNTAMQRPIPSPLRSLALPSCHCMHVSAASAAMPACGPGQRPQLLRPGGLPTADMPACGPSYMLAAPPPPRPRRTSAFPPLCVKHT